MQPQHALGRLGTKVVRDEALDADSLGGVDDLSLRLQERRRHGRDDDVGALENFLQPLRRHVLKVGLDERSTPAGDLNCSGLGEVADDGGDALMRMLAMRSASNAITVEGTHEGVAAQETLNDGLACLPGGTEDDDERLGLGHVEKC